MAKSFARNAMQRKAQVDRPRTVEYESQDEDDCLFSSEPNAARMRSGDGAGAHVGSPNVPLVNLIGRRTFKKSLEVAKRDSGA